MYQQHIESLEQSFKQAIANDGAPALAERMFDRFFKEYPETREIFADYNIAELGPKKIYLIYESLLDSVAYVDFSEDRLSEEVYRHLIHNVRDRDYYFGLIDAFIDAVKQARPTVWDSEVELHWQETAASMKHFIDKGCQEIY